MANWITTQNINDVVTGFRISCGIDVYAELKKTFDSIGGWFFQTFGSVIAQAMVDDNRDAMIEWLYDNLDDAVEIFTEEASLSRWSGNMIDNAVCGISGALPGWSGNTLYMDVRVGVNHDQIMNPANWTARPAKKMRANSTGTVYEYNGYRMHPGVDYSVWLNKGTAKIPNAARWAGFVKRAEERFWA